MTEAAQAVDVAPIGQPAEQQQANPGGTQDVQTIATTAVSAAEPAANEPKPNWPDDWRQKFAGNDEKLLARLGRFTSPENVLKSWLAAEKKISSGEYKKSLGKDATPEELAAWKQENGVPDKAEDYLADMQGLVIGEEDKVHTNSFLEHALAANMPKQYAQEAVKWYQNFLDSQSAAQQEADVNFQRQSEDKLRAEWGGEYRMNQNAIQSLAINEFGQELANELFQARLPDGSLLGNHPEICKAFASISRQLNPAATVVPGAGANAQNAIQTEMASLQKMMGDYSSEYWKGPSAERNQARYRELVGALEKMK